MSPPCSAKDTLIELCPLCPWLWCTDQLICCYPKGWRNTFYPATQHNQKGHQHTDLYFTSLSLSCCCHILEAKAGAARRHMTTAEKMNRADN